MNHTMHSGIAMRLICFTAVILAVGITATATAQGVPVRGRVVDQDGVPLVGVEIEVSSSISPDTMKGHTKKDGNFTIVVPRSTWEYVFRFRLDGHHEVLLPVDARVVSNKTVEVALLRYGTRFDSEIPFTEGGSTTLPRPRTETMTGQRRHAIELYDEGLATLGEGDTEAAEATFLRATVVDPNFPDPYRALAAIAEEAENWKSAARAAKALLRFEPDDLEAKWTVYNAMLRVGTERKLVSAAHLLASADRRSVDRIVNNSRDLFDIKDFVRARALAKIALEFTPESVDAYFVLGMSCNALGDTEATKAAIKHFLELAPADHPDITPVNRVFQQID
jgi:Flp pilus assembly protein TadD